MIAFTTALATEVDFSLTALFWQATFIVKVVMLMLIAASFWAWAIIVQKFYNYRTARTEAEAFDRAFWSGEPLDELYDVAALFENPSDERAAIEDFVVGERVVFTPGETLYQIAERLVNTNAGSSAASWKLMSSCLPEGTLIDTPDGLRAL